MSNKTIIRDDNQHRTMVTLRINADEVFSEKFKEYAEDLFLCTLAKHLGEDFCDPEKHYETYSQKILEVTAKAASFLPKKTGERLTRKENMGSTMAKLMEFVVVEKGEK